MSFGSSGATWFGRLVVTATALLCAVLVLPAMGQGTAQDTPQVREKASGELAWHTEYKPAYEQAEKEKRFLVVFFRDEDDTWCEQAVADLRSSPAGKRFVESAVWARLPLSAEVKIDGQIHRVLDTEAFAALENAPGAAVIDLTGDDPAVHGRVLQTVALGDVGVLAEGQLAELARFEGGARSGDEMDAGEADASAKLEWFYDYTTAVREAKARQRMLLIYFYSDTGAEAGSCRRFESSILQREGIRQKLSDYVLAWLPVDAEMTRGEGASAETTVILEHDSFSEMLGLPGVAIVDYASVDEPYYGSVVSVFPFLNGRVYTPEEMAVILELPPATLTQRTMIYAVRVHPENPASTEGELDEYLLDQAEKHSHHQARIRLQGHHNWNQRFQQISQHIPPGTLASEVCAESWPGQRLLEAALECVDCWRQSSGHWHAVKSPQRAYGYDIKRGANGVWYATGIFGGYYNR